MYFVIMNITIRPAAVSDLDAIHGFMCALTEKELDAAAFVECFKANIDREHYHHVIAEADGKAVGFISCYGFLSLHHCGMEYEIQELFVEEAYRSHKIGKQLLIEIESRIGTYNSLKLCSNIRRKDAHRFYLNNGFEQTGYRFIKKK